MNGKTKTLFIVIALVLISIAHNASAVAIGASPPLLSFTIAKGGLQEKTFQISTNSESPMLYSVAVSGPIEGLIKIKPEKGETANGKPAEIIVGASAARSAKPGNYSGTITATLKPGLTSSKGSGSVVATGVVIKVNLTITEETEPLGSIFLALIAVIVVVLIVVAFLCFKRYYLDSRK